MMAESARWSVLQKETWSPLVVMIRQYGCGMWRQELAIEYCEVIVELYRVLRFRLRGIRSPVAVKTLQCVYGTLGQEHVPIH
jgi:hypothetical protein